MQITTRSSISVKPRQIDLRGELERKGGWRGWGNINSFAAAREKLFLPHASHPASKRTVSPRRNGRKRMSLLKGIPPLQGKKAFCKRYFQCGCCPSQQTTRHALAGLLTRELGSLGPSRRDSNNGQKIRTSYEHSLTAAGPSRICTGIPCCQIAQEGQSITNALGGNILRLQATHKHPRPRVSFSTVSIAREKSPSPSAALFDSTHFPRRSLTVQRVHRPDPLPRLGVAIEPRFSTRDGSSKWQEYSSLRSVSCIQIDCSPLLSDRPKLRGPPSCCPPK